MIREDRYLVFKRTDLASIFSDEKLRALEIVLDSISSQMALSGLRDRNYVVVEDDWPEYEKVWDMIEERVGG